MIRARLLLAVISFAIVTALSGCEQASTAASAQSPPENLAARVKAVEDMIPSQSHMMADVGDHFANLWFAGRAENWPLAEFYLAETKSHLRWAVRRIPIRKDNQGRDINLGNILEAFENSQLTQLKGAIDGKAKAAFEKVYKESLTMCYSCHKAVNKPYLRPQIPTEPASRIINFDPKADWPL
jgi:cytochrome c553